MTILVTGSAGFIGNRTVQVLAMGGHDVIGVDNLNNGYDIELKIHRLNSQKLFKGVRFLKGDIEDVRFLKSVFAANSFDTVINLAGRAGVRYSIDNPDAYLQTNAQGTLNLLECMRESGVKKLVLASTSSLYAGHPLPFSEDMAVNFPNSPYAASKKAAEVMAYSYHYLFNIDVSVVRYFTVFGPAGRPDMSIFRFIRWIDEGVPLRINGDGFHSRDFTYIDDIVSGTLAAMRPLGYEIVNLGGGGEPVTLMDVISILEEILGKRAQLKYVDASSVDMRETRAVVMKAKELLDWSPQIDFKDGLQNTVDWYLENHELASSICL